MDEIKKIDKPFQKQVMKISQGSYGIVVPKGIIDEYKIEAGDVITGVFKSSQRQVKYK